MAAPIFGWIKCNSDAAWDENGSYGCIGIVVRNSAGDFMAAMVVWETRVDRRCMHRLLLHGVESLGKVFIEAMLAPYPRFCTYFIIQ
ncbi:hypothetical protein DVH24_025526 [Malus domestica]|uniref:RNase H type-1 domain-containing protein n=1 Tax=Malus domestica TaxID=3750 RepID=A0A498HR01_MALDO|nr:hypothetical protein DVH24_025526 [Malus domestica]